MNFFLSKNDNLSISQCNLVLDLNEPQVATKYDLLEF